MSNFVTLVTILVRACQNRIVGGDDIDISKVPYMLSFMLGGSHACGAAVIGQEWGITAGHCATAYKRDPYKEITIRTGSSIVNEGGIVHNISKVIWHEKYVTTDDANDIAVFKVEPKFEYSDVTGAVGLPEIGIPFDEEWGRITGWGYFIPDDPIISRKLQYLRLPKMNMEECVKDYAGLYKVKTSDVCYGFKQGGRDSCRGDSGGPLVSDDEILIGITSWGKGCAEENSPGLYTEVVQYRDWIKNKTGI
ncbi:trypsin 5G1-like isoform X2 [Belonocnema kinseyi]|uniref:trypsin 5G1-like isoform X2 n=1 Tax=Belonocnema kinseyi TaxID=2817044 RepID=UPI00143D7AB5|nr:trypsin 5G1-like isoform X2 [Belonocnema kinseyi]